MAMSRETLGGPGGEQHVYSKEIIIRGNRLHPRPSPFRKPSDHQNGPALTGAYRRLNPLDLGRIKGRKCEAGISQKAVGASASQWDVLIFSSPGSLDMPGWSATVTLNGGDPLQATSVLCRGV